MKTLALVTLASFCLSIASQAKQLTHNPLIMGGIVGSSGAPRAVVIQEQLPLGSVADPVLATAIQDELTNDLTNGKVAAHYRIDEEVVNGMGRTRWCIEYKSAYDQFIRKNEIENNLKNLSSSHIISAQFEVVENANCQLK
jgi:hypothetical protein